MARTPPRCACLVLSLLLPVSLGNALAGDDDPSTAIPVSPGTQEAGALIGDPCPSFSWGAVDGAQRYELAIFDAQWQDSPAYDDQRSQGLALRQIEISAPALSWTPAGSDCLDEGGSYLWFVRAQTADGDGLWSAPRYFEIDYDADALTQTVRRELTAQLRRPEVWREVIGAALSSNPTLQLASLASGVVAPTSAGDGTRSTGAGSGLAGAVTEQAIGILATTFPNPSALKVNSPNGVVFNQSATGGSIPAAGAGTRFMWYPGKAALRAGSVNETQWDNDNVGLYSMAVGYSTTANNLASTAMGYSTTASGLNSTAMGLQATASGESSTAMGSGAQAIGHYSTAMGYYTTASSSGSTATGYGSRATGPGSTAMGNSAVASGNSSTAMGGTTTASGESSTAMGAETTASGYASTATGGSTTASGYASTAMGGSTTASGYASTAMGYGTIAESDYELVIGHYDTNYTPTGNDRDRLFVIGNGTSDGGRSDALVVQGTGNLTISGGGAYKPGGGSWDNSSDARLKGILGVYSSGLDEIAALQAVRYHYAEGNARSHDPEPEYVGFIAQQVQPVFPEAVSEGADGYLDFNMHAVNVAMVNAIQKLNEQNQVQQELILDLRSENTVLMQRYAAQEQRLINLEKENARLARLQADLAQIQAQLRVLQHQLPGLPTYRTVARED